ncbi:MAG TPA: methyltransferase domain-containing protein [Thermodesulfobacteriota bacterium]|nr:methyltransferase domain-containing protein [Thermodesulfobacteriota bacterium]
MKRSGLYRPTIEEAIEISGIETLHPGGFALTKRTAELAELREGLTVLDVSSGRGTQSIFYAKEFGARVTGIDISGEMVRTAALNARQAEMDGKVQFRIGDSQNLPFEDNHFDVVINECAVGIPDDSQKVLTEMVRVAKPEGKILIHESTWREQLPKEEKTDFAERYGTTPLELTEWIAMLEKAGITKIVYEFDQWSKPEMFWKIRKDREVKHWFFTMTIPEKLRTMKKIFHQYGAKGILTIMRNERVFYKTVLEGKLGYALFKGEK